MKVKIQVFYVSSLGTEIHNDYEADDMQEAKTLVENNITKWDTPHIAPNVTTVEEDGMEYDRTTYIKYNFSHISIVDYTDGREKTENK